MLRETCKEKAHKQHTDLSKSDAISSSVLVQPPQHTPPSPLLPQETSNTWNKDALPSLCFTQLLSTNTENRQLEAQDTKLKTNEHS